MAERRQHQRVRPYKASTCLGQVLDLSQSGMKLFRRGKLNLQVGQRIEADLQGKDHEIRVAARVLRIEKLGFRRHAIAMEFLDLSPEQHGGIAAIVAAEDEYLSPTLWQKTSGSAPRP